MRENLEMAVVKRIMACVDLSEHSKETLSYALALAGGFQAEVIIYTVINIRDVEAVRKASRFYPDLINVENYQEAVKADRHEQIEKMLQAESASEKAEVSILVGVGVPFKEILDAIKGEQIDLVVLGAKGRTNVAGPFFGSVAEKVFRYSAVPVVSVRNREISDRNAQPGGSVMFGIERITAAVDLSDYSLSVIAYAAEIAEKCAAEITVVNVISRKFVDVVEKVYNDQHPDQFSQKKFINDETHRRTQNLQELISQYIPKEVPARAIVRSGTPFEEIIGTAVDDKADLLVVAPKGRSNLPDYLFGTTTEKIFRHAPMSVLRVSLMKDA